MIFCVWPAKGLQMQISLSYLWYNAMNGNIHVNIVHGSFLKPN